METLVILSLILNLAAVVGVILLHVRQVAFERRVGIYITQASQTIHSEIVAAKSALLKAVIVGGVAALFTMFSKKDETPAEHV